MFGTFVCVYVCVCSCIVYFCYLRFTDKKKTIYFWIKLFAYIVALQALHVTHSTLVELSLSLSPAFCFVLLWFLASLLASTCASFIHCLQAHFPQEFQQFSHIIHAFSAATRRERLRDFQHNTASRFFFFSFSLSLSPHACCSFCFCFCCFFLYFFNTRFAHVDVSFAVVVARCI